MRADAEPITPARGRRRRVLALLIGLVVLALLAAVVWYVALGPGRAGGLPGSTVVELSGEGDFESDSFFVRSGWQIHWETVGESFEYALEGDTSIGTVIRQEGPGSGITSPVPAGNFRIVVTAEGPWRIEVIQGD